MSAEELRRAIELPARRAGIRVESALVDRLVEEVGEAAGGLPLLSTALVELWEQREGGWLRLDAYERSGGIARCASPVSPSRRTASSTTRDARRRRRCSCASSGPVKGDAVTRRRVPLDEFDTESDPAAAEVLRRFTRDRLLTADDRRSRCRTKRCCANGRDSEPGSRRTRRAGSSASHLTGAARVWARGRQDDSELYRGARLSSALDWAALHGRQLNELEREFLTASRQRSDREAERQRRTNRRLRGLLAGVAVFLVWRWSPARSRWCSAAGRGPARRLAQVKATQALAQSLGAKGFAQPQLSRALLLAHEGTNLAPSDDTEGSMLSTLLRAPEVLHTYTAPEIGASAAGRTDRRREDPRRRDELGRHRLLRRGDRVPRSVCTTGRQRSNVICCGHAPGGNAIAVVESAKRVVPEVIDPHSGAVVRTFANDPYLSTQAEAGALYSLDPAESTRRSMVLLSAYSTGRSERPDGSRRCPRGSTAGTSPPAAWCSQRRDREGLDPRARSRERRLDDRR